MRAESRAEEIKNRNRDFLQKKFEFRSANPTSWYEPLVLALSDSFLFEKQYKNHLSGLHNWAQKEHAEKWMIFPENIVQNLSLDEVALTNGELFYTVITNKGHSMAKKEPWRP